jgi:hypothetical protein
MDGARRWLRFSVSRSVWLRLSAATCRAIGTRAAAFNVPHPVSEIEFANETLGATSGARRLRFHDTRATRAHNRARFRQASRLSVRSRSPFNPSTIIT